jgi:hypothetical protein
MHGKRIQEEMVAKHFQDQDWALDERILVYQVVIVPDTLALQGWRMNDESRHCESEAADPFGA